MFGCAGVPRRHFGLKAGLSIGPREFAAKEHLDGDRSLRSRLSCLVHDSHATTTNLANDLVVLPGGKQLRRVTGRLPRPGWGGRTRVADMSDRRGFGRLRCLIPDRHRVRNHLPAAVGTVGQGRRRTFVGGDAVAAIQTAKSRHAHTVARDFLTNQIQELRRRRE